MTTRIVADSAFGCAGQRCLASSVAITVGEAGKTFTPHIAEAAASRKSATALDEGIEMGPVISRREPDAHRGPHRRRRRGGRQAARGRPRGAQCPGYDEGYFVRPTVLADVDPAASWRGRRSSVRC